MGCQLIKALGPLSNVVLVVQTLVDDDVHPGEHQGGIGPRFDWQPVIGLGGDARLAGVDDDDLCPSCVCVCEILHDGVASVLTDVATDQRHRLDAVPIDGLVTANGRAVRQRGCLVTRAEAERRRRLCGVWSSPRLGKVVGEPGITRGVTENGKRFLPVLVLDVQKGGGDVVERLFPGDFLELA